jgi:Zn-dependent peptidase ImmA (M78 family)
MGAKFNPEILAVARGARGHSQEEFARLLGWSQGKVSKIEHGMLSVESEEAQRIANALRYPVELFYQEDVVRGFGSCCLYHRKRATTPVRVLNQLHDTLNIRRIQVGRLVKGITLPHEPNFPSLDIDEYENPAHIAQMLRAAWGLPRGPIRNLVDVVEAAGGVVVLLDLGTPKIDAVSQRVSGLPPFFFLDRSKPADRCRWTLAHEIGHIVMHQTPSANAEEEADKFASEFLMPSTEIRPELDNLTIPKAASAKLRWRASMQAIIRKAKDTQAISQRQYESLCVRISQLGYRKNEPNPIAPERPTMLRKIIDLHLSNCGYSVADLSASMLSLEDEFREVYLRDEGQPQLRVHRH